MKNLDHENIYLAEPGRASGSAKGRRAELPKNQSTKLLS
jgi:hypothetical protein